MPAASTAGRASFGCHYDGRKIGVGTGAPGMEQPVHCWDPSIAPSGMAFYTRGLFPGQRRNVFIGPLAVEASRAAAPPRRVSDAP